MFEYPYFKIDALSGFIGIAIVFFSALTLIYSSAFMKGRRRFWEYYAYMILTAAVSLAAVFANNLILLLIFWGALALLLYQLIGMGLNKSAEAAKKALVIVGGTDALMLLGIVFIYVLTGTLQMDQARLSFSTGNPLIIVSYLCIAAACFAKAGMMPFHSWVPDACQKAPVPVAAFLPASLDKLLGIYLLTRASMDLFILNGAMNIFLMLIGAVTILAAVLMALVQHNMKRLLGYHAVSQVGYMVLGIGTASPIGIAGGLFHMLNNAIYKSCLFMTAGNVEHRAGTTELDELGGLSKAMPLTYISCLVASLSISGLPPFNGFVSKWMIYQGILDQPAGTQSPVFKVVAIFCLVAAMFASGLTLASFIKLLHAVFLGQKTGVQGRTISEVPLAMWLPCLVLASLCALFGIFANQLPLKYFILPAVAGADYVSGWYTKIALLFVLAGLVSGWVIYKLKWPHLLKMRQDGPALGGEAKDFAPCAVEATGFYNAVREHRALKRLYALAQKGAFDIYEQGKRVFAFSNILRSLHNGVLPTYLVWVLLGMAFLLVVLR